MSDWIIRFLLGAVIEASGRTNYRMWTPQSEACSRWYWHLPARFRTEAQEVMDADRRPRGTIQP